MEKLTKAVVVLALVCDSALVCAGETKPGLNRLGENAALTYWRAFAMIPKTTKAENKLVAPTGSGLVPDGKSKKLVVKWQTALRLLHDGATMPNCDWGVNWAKEGPGALLPHLAKARALARAACFRARYRWALGETEEAVEDLRAAIILARHVGPDTGNVLIGVLVKIAIERMALNVVTERLTAMAPETLALVAERLANLPEHGSLRDVILTEKEWSVSWLKRFVREKAEQDEFADFTSTLDDLGIPKQKQDELRATTGGTADALLRLLDEAEGFYDELAKLVALPIDEFDDRFAAFNRKVESARNAVVQSMLPGIGRVRYTHARAQIEWVMLKAAIAVRQSGTDALDRFKDPCGNGRFGYEELDGGFRLRSKLMHDAKPVTLTFGAEAARQTE